MKITVYLITGEQETWIVPKTTVLSTVLKYYPEGSIRKCICKQLHGH